MRAVNMTPGVRDCVIQSTSNRDIYLPTGAPGTLWRRHQLLGFSVNNSTQLTAVVDSIDRFPENLCLPFDGIVVLSGSYADRD